jgi:hypothetical protein
MDLIDNLLKEFLMSLNEAEFGIHFQALLRAMNYSSIDTITRHGPGEHGKDVVATARIEGTEYVFMFQLKVGEINVHRFRTEVRPQLESMLTVPVEHPSVKSDLPKKPVLVITGDLIGDAPKELFEFNKKYQKLGEPSIEVWNINYLIRIFSENMTSLAIFPEEIKQDISRVWLSINAKGYDRELLRDLLNRCLSSYEVPEKRLTIASLFSTVMALYACKNDNHPEGIDILRLCLMKMWEYLYRNGFDHVNKFDQLHEEYLNTLKTYVENLKSRINLPNGIFYRERGLSEAISYPLRTFDLIGILGYLSFVERLNRNKSTSDEYSSLIARVIRNNSSSQRPLRDINRKDIAIALIALYDSNMHEDAAMWIKNMLKYLSDQFIKNGKLPSGSESAEEMIKDMFYEEKDRRKERGEQASFLIPILFEFCLLFKVGDIYQKYVSIFWDAHLQEYIPPNDTKVAEEQMYQEVMPKGTVKMLAFPVKFDEYRSYFLKNQMQSFGYSGIIQKKPYVLQIISDVFGDRTFPEIWRPRIK